MSAGGPAAAHPDHDLRFSLEHWRLWHSATVTSHQTWPGGEVLPHVAGGADVQFIPMLQRRRMSPLARAACAVAWQCREKAGDLPAVYCSLHGESQDYFGLLEELSRNQPLSPSRFSLCVHNAIAGLFSIQSRCTLPYVALAGGSDGLFAAFLEAAGLLLETPRVLLVCYEQPLPQAYQAYLTTSDTTWALAMVLSRPTAGKRQLCLSRDLFDPPSFGREPSSDLIQAILTDSHRGYTQLERATWHWSLQNV